MVFCDIIFKNSERIKPDLPEIQRFSVRCEENRLSAELHSGVVPLKSSRRGRVCPLQLNEVRHLLNESGWYSEYFRPCAFL